MKKTLFLVAVATLFFSCQKENEPSSNEVSKPFAFQASIEQPASDSKANIDASNGLVWQDGDKIGIYVSSWAENSHQQFDLSSGAGTTSGTFVRNQDAGWFETADATVAFFPWQGKGTDKNNYYEGNVYFKLPNWYDDYTTSGKMLTPLVAPVVYSGTEWVYNPIQFKHVGAAVKLTINNLVSGGYKAKMSVTGKQITGDFHVNPANAGSEALTLDAAEDTDKNYVTLNSWKSSGAFSWVFPVPTLSKPKIQFEITDGNGITVWSKNLKAQANDLNRGDILVMPAIDITPYSQFTQDDACTWSFSGTIGGSAWKDNIPMVSDGRYWILSGLTFAVGDEFKIRKDKDWGEAYPSSNWVFTAGNAGAKDIIFDSAAAADDPNKIRVVSHSFPYPAAVLPAEPATITIDGNMSDWALLPSLSSTGTSRVRSWKFASDATNLYFYLVLRKNKMRTAYNVTLGFSWDESGSYTGDNLTGLESVVVFQPFTNAAAGTPDCVDGTLNDATINGSAVDNAGIEVYGYDPDSGASGESADYLIEFSIPKAKIPSLPSSGTIQAGAGYEWYNTSLQDITL